MVNDKSNRSGYKVEKIGMVRSNFEGHIEQTALECNPRGTRRRGRPVNSWRMDYETWRFNATFTRALQ